MASTYSPQERQYYDQLFSVIDNDNSGVLPGHSALPFLVSSSLPQQTLGEIWASVDPNNNGFLTRESWYKAARLIGWMQKGDQSKVDEALVSRSGPYPIFQGHPPPPVPASVDNSVTSLPTLTPSDRSKFTRIFVGCGPQNGLVLGDKARDVFVKSQLPYDKLGEIWNLADTQERGSLDLTDFIIGMYLIQSCMANPSLALPSTLPPGTYEQASGGRPAPLSPVAPQRTGSSMRPQYTGPSSPQRAASPPRASSTLSTLPSTSSFASPWDVTPDAKVASDRFFSQLDTQNRGVVEGDVAVPFMVQSQLDEATLASIWELADIRHEGKLDRDQFAVAMHLINAKLAGKDVPATLPLSLVPPSLRNEHSAGPQEMLSGPATATRDLFDLFDDGPSAQLSTPPKTSPAPFRSSTFLPQPPSRRGTTQARQFLSSQATIPSPTSAPSNDLLGDDSNPAPVLDSSADVGNKQNELSNTERALGETQKNRETLEKTATSLQSQLADLTSKLSSARSKHDAETRAVDDLRVRVNEQTSELQKLQADVIAAESDLSAMKSEKVELEQALLRDREEVRALQRRMKEMDADKTTLKTALEKMRKESRQQKGMVTIAKKQVSTSEASRDTVQKEIDEQAVPNATPFVTPTLPETVPLPGAPQALSPVATGISQRSNNPFDRLNRGSSSSLPSHMETSAPSVGVMAIAANVMSSDDGFIPKTELASSSVDGTPEVPDGQATSAEAISDYPLQASTPVPSGTVAREATDSFGMPLAVNAAKTKETPLDSGFGDSFVTSQEAQQHAPPADAPTDFDTAFADFDRSTTPPRVSTAVSSDQSAPPIPVTSASLGGEVSAGPADPQQPVVLSSSLTRGPEDLEELASSDDETGPEDIEEPHAVHQDKTTLESALPDTDTAKVRRSAPPPPARSQDPDPFSVPGPVPDSIQTPDPVVQHNLPEAVSNSPPSKTIVVPETTKFEEDDFDFSDLPPARIEQAEPLPSQAGRNPQSTTFDDEFAGFDDEFEQESSHINTGSDQSNSMTKSYEIVPPSVPKDPAPQSFDEWGFGQSVTPHAPAPQTALSFDDAFGGDFESAPVTSQAHQISSSTAPPLPERSETAVQSDDIEDVKKLCAMGFSRSLVIPALDANGYDFQKTLNVLLAQ